MLLSGHSILDFVGRTPLVELDFLNNGSPQRLFAKVEYYSPSGGPKDRVVRHIIDRAVRDGRLRAGMTLIEASTGSTGIAVSLHGAVLGYEVVIVMPEGMSRERRQLMEALGAKLELTVGGGSDIENSLRRVQEIIATAPERYFYVNQFANPGNVEAHYYGTGREIWEDCAGQINGFVTMVGTGGTLTGVARYLRERKADIRVFAGEPQGSPTYLTGRRAPHVIEGVGDGIVPEIFDRTMVDGFVLVSDAETIEMCQRLAHRGGLLVGPSSGANVMAAMKVMRAYPELRNVVTVLPDSGMRYLSRGLFTEYAGPVSETCRVALPKLTGKIVIQ